MSITDTDVRGLMSVKNDISMSCVTADTHFDTGEVCVSAGGADICQDLIWFYLCVVVR